MEPQIGFCTNPDGVRIGYATLGQGPAMIIPPHYFATITPYKTLPEVRYILDTFARYHTVVIYDPRGAGLSDRNRTVFTLESELRDLETVVDHLKLDRIILYGVGMSGPIVIAYAAKYPERVTHLILYGTYANHGRFLTEEYKASVVSLLRQPDNWLGARAINDLAGSQAPTDYLEVLMGLLKDITTNEMVANFMDMAYKLDVTHLCPRIKTPTLVMHRKGDKLVDFKVGLELASLIPNARFIQLEGEIHYYMLGDTESFLRSIFEFLGDPITDDKAAKAVRPTTKKSGHDVFISFAFEDREYASKIYAHLKGSGICPFWCEDVTAGGDYPQLLGEAIRNSKSFLLVLSDSSDNSASVRKETTIAHNNKKTIIPVRIKNVLPKNLEYLIANSLFFDAFPQPIEQHLPRLTGDIKKIVGGKTDKKEKIKK
ncbi:MAG: alpha/beta fold hydrolase [Dehalococcoidia bacterium]